MDSTEEKDKISALDVDGRKSRVFTGRTTRAKLVRFCFVGTLMKLQEHETFLPIISKEIGKPFAFRSDYVHPLLFSCSFRAGV